jgi:histidine triad (HIT) family protein
MKSHAPDDSQNTFIRTVQGVEDDVTLSKRSDVFYQDATLTAFISAGRPPNIPFSTLVVPNTPFENLYEMPDDVLCAVHRFAKRLALALKGQFGCEGVSLRQHNEPAGGQDVWHYHLRHAALYGRPVPRRELALARDHADRARSVRSEVTPVFRLTRTIMHLVA